MTLQEFIAGIIAGGMSYPVAKFLFQEVVPSHLSSRVKRLIAYAVSFLLAIVALVVGQVFGYLTFTPDTVFTAFVTAFTTSQALHMWLELGQSSHA